MDFGFEKPRKVGLNDRRRIARAIVREIGERAAERHGREFRVIVVKDEVEAVETSDGEVVELHPDELALVRQARDWVATGEGPQPAIPED